jgi:hypothetical protein
VRWLAVRKNENGRNASRDPRIYRKVKKVEGRPSARNLIHEGGGFFCRFDQFQAVWRSLEFREAPSTDEQSAVVRM